MRRHLSPALVLSVLAVILATTAGATAASSLITGKQIKNSSITGADIKDRSISGDEIKGATIGPSKLSDGLLSDIEAPGPVGPPGAAGPAGPAGTTGPAGPSDLSGITVVSSPQVPFGATDIVMGATAFCPAGQKVVSGGGVSISDEQLAASSPNADRSGWFVIGIDLNDNGGEYVQAQALCAATGKAVTAATTSRKAALAHVEALVRRIAAERDAVR